MGVRFVDIAGTRGAELELPDPSRRTDFYLKFLIDPSGKGFDSDPGARLLPPRGEDPLAVGGRRRGHAAPSRRSTRWPISLCATCVSIELGERSSVQSGEIKGTVSPDDVLPYVHQRYDDLSVIGATG